MTDEQITRCQTQTDGYLGTAAQAKRCELFEPEPDKSLWKER